MGKFVYMKYLQKNKDNWQEVNYSIFLHRDYKLNVNISISYKFGYSVYKKFIKGLRDGVFEKIEISLHI